jgi:hypothetical protein
VDRNGTPNPNEVERGSATLTLVDEAAFPARVPVSVDAELVDVGIPNA